MCACVRVRAHRLKAAPEQRAGGWASEGPTWRRLTWRFAAVSALRSRSVSGSLSLSLSHTHTHTDVHAPHSTAPRPELVLQSPHTQRTAISPDKAPLCSSLHELIPPALWPQLGLLTRETDRERERERGGEAGGGGNAHTHTHVHTQAHTLTTTHTRAHTHSPLPHAYVHAHTSQHREKVSGSRERKERQGQTHSERRGRHWEWVRQSGNPDGDRKTGRQRGCRAPGTEHVLELQRAGASWSQCVRCTHNPDTPRTFPAAPTVGVRQVVHPPTEPQGQRAVGRSFAGVEGALERLGTTQGKEQRRMAGSNTASAPTMHQVLAASLAPMTGEAQLFFWAACGMGI